MTDSARAHTIHRPFKRLLSCNSRGKIAARDAHAILDAPSSKPISRRKRPAVSPNQHRLSLRVLAIALCCLFLGLEAPQQAGAQVSTADAVCGKTAASRGIAEGDLPDIEARAAYVMGKDGTVYYGRCADEQVKIASITKVMTAILTLENTKDAEVITVGDDAANVGESTAGLVSGDRLTVEQALRGLMIPSGNDAAIALAEFVGKRLDPKTKDAQATFVAAMNKRAKELGCTDTVFENPHGLDFDEWAGNMHSTAHDVALMMQHAMTFDTFRSTIASTDSWIEVTGADGTDHSHSMDAHNYLLGQDGNIGGKTGTTDDAGYCFTAAYDRDGDEVYTVVLGSTTTDQRFDDTATLADWYYGHRVTVALAAGAQKKTANGNPLMARVAQTDWTDKTVDATLADPAQTVSVFSLAGDLKESASYENVSGTVHVGDKVGTVTLKQGGKKIAKADLVADEEAAGPNPIEWLLVKLDRLGRRIDNRPLTAESEETAAVPAL